MSAPLPSVADQDPVLPPAFVDAPPSDDPIQRASALERSHGPPGAEAPGRPREAMWLVGAGLEGIREGQARCRREKRPPGSSSC